MSLAESILLALTSLRSNKMRALLTLLGVIIGIASVIGILTIGKALQDQTLNSLESLGANDLSAQVEERPDEDSPEPDMFAFSGAANSSGNLIPEETVYTLRDRFAGSITGISVGGMGTQGTLIGDTADLKSDLLGVNEDYMWMNGVEMNYGRAITQDDVAAQRPVAVIAPDTFNTLFDANPNLALGSEVAFELNGQETFLRVIGVYKEAAAGGLVGSMPTVNTYTPYTVANDITHTEDGFNTLSIRAAQGVDQDSLKGSLQTYFDALYANNDSHHVAMLDFRKQIEEFNTILGAMSLGISAIGGISLLVGGIGVMNIMLVSVTERTREIGVRKALGARRRDIRLQFVVEAMIICFIGGILGVFLGGILGLIMSSAIGYISLPPLSGIVIALVFSMAIGLFFGYYPANKAAKLDPIDALRYE